VPDAPTPTLAVAWRAARTERRREALAAAGYLARTSGLAAARRALPTYLALFVVAVILFAGNGLRAADVVALARGSLPVRGALLAAWLLLALPAARAVVTEPAAFWVRVWPVPRAVALAVVAALLAAAEAPWILLWAKGAGVAAGGAAAVVAIAGHGIVLGRPRTRWEAAAAAAWVAAVAALRWPALAALAAAPAAALGVRRAWIAAPERIGVRRAARVVVAGRRPAVTWARALLAMLARGQRPSVVRALWFLAGGALAARLAIANNGVDDPARARAIWRVAAALAAAWGAAGLVGGVRRIEAQARWLLDVSGASARSRRAGAWLALVVPGAALGAVAGAGLAAAGVPFAAAAAVLDGAVAAAVGAAVVAACGRWACRGDGRDGARLLPAVLGASALLAPLAFLAPAPPLALLALAALATPDGDARRPRAGGPRSLAGEV
jgi:hypothetical protein